MEGRDRQDDVEISHRLKVEKMLNGMNGDKEVRKAIGIDFGTSDSCVSVWGEGRIHTVANERGEQIIPSCVAFTLEGQCLVGHAAKNQLKIIPENRIEHIKRLLGMSFTDKTLQSEIKYFPFEVIDKNNKPCIQMKSNSGKKEFYPEEITAMIFKELKETGEKYLGEEVSHAVVTVPASFNSRQRQAVIDAGSIARLNVRILNEPTASAVGFYGNEDVSNKNILVFHLGAGSFEVTVLKKHQKDFKVIATGGNTHISGIEFTRRATDYFVDIYRQKITGDDKCFLQEFQKNVERAKQILSLFPTVNAVKVKCPGDKFILGELTRSKFDELNKDLFQSTIDVTKDVLNSANMTKNDIDEIILTGGSTVIPKIQQIVNDFFECKEQVYVSKENPSLGTAKMASTLYDEDDAADSNGVVVSDVIGLSLGIKLIGGSMCVIVPRNKSIPVKEQKFFTTGRDNQEGILFEVYEGEHEMVENDNFLDILSLEGIEKAPKGIPKIEVTMEININGILLVSARDMATRSEDNIAIDYFRKRFEQSEIEQMIANVGI